VLSSGIKEQQIWIDIGGRKEEKKKDQREGGRQELKL